MFGQQPRFCCAPESKDLRFVRPRKSVEVGDEARIRFRLQYHFQARSDCYAAAAALVRLSTT
jgi:hypothetical protein